MTPPLPPPCQIGEGIMASETAAPRGEHGGSGKLCRDACSRRSSDRATLAARVAGAGALQRGTQVQERGWQS
jgi:hypothetical protein